MWSCACRLICVAEWIPIVCLLFFFRLLFRLLKFQTIYLQASEVSDNLPTGFWNSRQSTRGLLKFQKIYPRVSEVPDTLLAGFWICSPNYAKDCTSLPTTADVMAASTWSPTFVKVQTWLILFGNIPLHFANVYCQTTPRPGTSPNNYWTIVYWPIFWSLGSSCLAYWSERHSRVANCYAEVGQVKW